MGCEPLAAEPRQAGDRGAKADDSSAMSEVWPPCYDRSMRCTSGSSSGLTKSASSTTRSEPRPSRRGFSS
eukprot:11196459-Heterocapsa_arctica.AAC.1